MGWETSLNYIDLASLYRIIKITRLSGIVRVAVF